MPAPPRPPEAVFRAAEALARAIVAREARREEIHGAHHVRAGEG
jgi:hypothetical protein